MCIRDRFRTRPFSFGRGLGLDNDGVTLLSGHTVCRKHDTVETALNVITSSATVEIDFLEMEQKEMLTKVLVVCVNLFPTSQNSRSEREVQNTLPYNYICFWNNTRVYECLNN